jgi:hypothetical protein
MLMRFVCWIGLLLGMTGCREVTNDDAHTSPSAPKHSVYNPPTSSVRQVASVRQIAITNAFVVGAKYAELRRASPEALRQQNPSPEFLTGAYYTATNLAKQIASTDHILVTNCCPMFKESSRITLLLSGDAATQVVRAVSSSGRYQIQERPGWWFPDWEMRFYKGSERLASVLFLGSGFTEEFNHYKDYGDYSGVLGTLYDTAVSAAEGE